MLSRNFISLVTFICGSFSFTISEKEIDFPSKFDTAEF